MKKILMIIGCIVLLSAGVGAKIHMDNEKRQTQTRLVELAKNTFKDIKKIKIIEKGEASPGSTFIVVEITNNENKKYKVDLDNDGSVGSVGGDTTYETQMGRTKEKVKVIYLSGEREMV